MSAIIDDLVAQLRSTDDSVRGSAWQRAGSAGASAVKPLSALLGDLDFEISRSAKRALYQIVRHAGRPGAVAEARAVAAELVLLLGSETPAVRREALWLLSEIGSDEAVAPMAALLTVPELREDVRCALMRLPGAAVTAALKRAFGGAPEEFKPALAEALRKRGEPVDGFPSQKLVPTRSTVITQSDLAKPGPS